MTLSQRQAIFAHNVSTLIQYINLNNHTCTFGEAYRTPEQAAIYAQSGKGIVDSLHCKRLAIDLNIFHNNIYLTDSKDYEIFGIFWESLSPSNKWGGRWTKLKDGNHFQMDE